MKKVIFISFVLSIVVVLAGCISKPNVSTHSVLIERVGTKVHDYFEVSGSGSVHYLDPSTGKYLRAENNKVPVYLSGEEEFIQVGTITVEMIGAPYEEIDFMFELASDYYWKVPFDNASAGIVVGSAINGTINSCTGKYDITVNYTPDSFATDVSLSVSAGTETLLNTDQVVCDVGKKLSDVTDDYSEYGIFVNGIFVGDVTTGRPVDLYDNHTEVGKLKMEYGLGKGLKTTDTVTFTLAAAAGVAKKCGQANIVEICKYTDYNGLIVKQGNWCAFNVSCVINSGVVILESICSNTEKLVGVTELYYLTSGGKWVPLNLLTKVPVFSLSGDFIGNISGAEGTVVFHGEGSETTTDQRGKKVYASAGAGEIILKAGTVVGGVFTEVTGEYTVTCINSGYANKEYGPLSAFSGASDCFYYSLGRSDVDVKALMLNKYSFRYRTQEYDDAVSQQYWSDWKTFDSEEQAEVKGIISGGTSAIGTLSHGTKVEESMVKFTFTAEVTGSGSASSGKVQVALIYGEVTQKLLSRQSVVDIFEISCVNKGANSAK